MPASVPDSAGDKTWSGNGADRRHGGGLPDAMALLPAAFLVLLLVVATWWDGAFDVQHWTPPALFALVVLAVLNAAGVVPRRSPPVALALAGIWGLATLSLLSALWSESPGAAWEGFNRMLLYAALASIALSAVPDRRAARLVGGGLVAGVTAIALITLGLLLIDGENMFLAGRLDEPVSYRNATALLFAVAFWPLVVVAAARERHAGLRAAALAAAVLTLGLAFLTQSRGVIVGLVLGGILAIAAGPDRLRRAWAALLAAALVALVSPLLLEPYHAWDAGRGVATDADIAGAGAALGGATVLAFLGCLLLVLLDQGLRAGSRAMGRMRTLTRALLAALAVLGAVAALALIGNPASYAEEKWDEFRSLDATVGPTRLTAAGGQRYDVWRIALRVFGDSPLLGQGAGSYPARYYRDRATDRNLNNPHSLVFSLLAETGLAGLALFFAFLAGVGWALVRAWRLAAVEQRRAATALAAVAAVVFGAAAVDWTWLVPAVMGIGFFSAGLAVAAIDRSRETRRVPPVWLRAGRSVGLALAAVCTFLLLVSDFQLRKADAAAGRSPSEQLAAARTAERVNPLAVEPRWAQAGALESLGRVAEAREELRSALDLEPKSFATLALLGDLEARAGRRHAALRYYRRALALNPRDVGLRRLARGRWK